MNWSYSHNLLLKVNANELVFLSGKTVRAFSTGSWEMHKEGKGRGAFSQTPVRHEVKEMSLSFQHRMLETDYLLYYKRFSEQANKKCSQPACY